MPIRSPQSAKPEILQASLTAEDALTLFIKTTRVIDDIGRPARYENAEEGREDPRACDPAGYGNFASRIVGGSQVTNPPIRRA